MHRLHKDVEGLLRKVSAQVVMPRFRALAAHEVNEKSPGELVTVADHESELMLEEGLARIDADARPVGEEACSADPSLLDGLGEGRLWLIDPIDGTSNFAAGHGPFGLMLALVEDGVVQASWLFDPLANRLCHAVAGGGAYIDGQRVMAMAPQRARPIAALASQFLAPEDREWLHGHAGAAMELVPIPRCAAEHYPRLCLGENDVAFFQRTLPWDHAAGALFLVEAGGAVSRWDGEAYGIGDGKSGLLAANSQGNLSLMQSLLEECGLAHRLSAAVRHGSGERRRYDRP